MTVTLPNGRETDQDEWTFVMGMDAFRICRGQPPKYFTHAEVVKWIQGMTPCATPAMKVGTPAQAESPGDEVQKGKP